MPSPRDSHIPVPTGRGRAAKRSSTAGSRSSGSENSTLSTSSSSVTSDHDDDTKLGVAEQRIAELELQLNIAKMGHDEDAPTKDDLERQKSQTELWRKKWVDLDKKLKEGQNADTQRDVKVKQLEDAISALQQSGSLLQQQASQVPGLQSRLHELEALKTKAEERASLAELDAEAKDEVLEICETTHKGLTEQNPSLAESCTELKGQVSALQEQLALIETSNESKIISLETERNELANQLKEANNARSTAESQLAQASSTQPTLPIDQEKQALAAQVERLTSQLAAAQAHEEYIASLEQQNETLDTQLADAVSESRRKDFMLSRLQAQYRGLEAKVKEVEAWRSAAQNDKLAASTADARAAGAENGGGLRVTNLAPGDISEPNTPVGLTKDMEKEIEERVEAATAVAVAKALAAQPARSVQPPATPAPAPTPVAITITIDPADRANWTWLQKTKAAVGQYTAIGYEGPDEHVSELQSRMKEHVVEFSEAKKELGTLRKQVDILEKRPACVEPSHKNFADTMHALENQVHMQQDLLLEYGRKCREG